MKNRLNWHVDQTDVWGNVRGYSAIFDVRITNTIRFYIRYRVYMNNADEWCFVIVQTSPNCDASVSVKYYNPEIGKKMAEDELQKIFDGIKNFLTINSIYGIIQLSVKENCGYVYAKRTFR